jgi:hypothetical protein
MAIENRAEVAVMTAGDERRTADGLSVIKIIEATTGVF